MVEHKDAFGSVFIPEDWSLIPLGKCVTEKLSYGINAPAIPFDGKSPAYIRITDITEDGRFDNSDRKAVQTNEREKYMLREGDIVLARTGASTGKTYLYDKRDGELVYAGFLIKASIDINQHNPRFIVGQLRTPRYWSWVAAMSMRSGQPGINGKEYSSFLVPVAPKEEQDAIANALAEFDTHIANLAELIEKKKGIRDGALEDLVSGRTRLTGYTDEWSKTTIGACAEIFQGGTPSTTNSRFWGGSVIWVTPSEITKLPTMYIDDSERKITEEGVQNSSAKLLPAGTILLCTRATIGDLAIAKKPMTTNQGFKNLVCNSDVHNVFFAYLLRTLKPIMLSLAIGTTFLEISKRNLSSIEISMPNYPEQKAIADVLAAMDKEIKDLEDERNKMIQIREGAMDDLLTGWVRLTV